MVRVALNIPDCHIPFHCEKSYNLMLEVAKDVDAQIGLEEINILGDYLDIFWLNMHPKGPASVEVRENFRDEIYQGNKKLDELRNTFPHARIRFIEGNHCFRALRYIISKCPDLYGLYTIQELLKLPDRNIEFIPYGKAQRVSCLGSNLFLRHQPYNQGKTCAATTAHNKGISLLFGHTHRIQSYTLVKGDGSEANVYSTGWLGDRNQPVFEYMDTDDWSLGFTFTYFVPPDPENFHVHQIHIKRGCAVYNGTLYEA